MACALTVWPILAPVMLVFAIAIVLFVLCIRRRQCDPSIRPSPRTASWFIKNDQEIARLVLLLASLDHAPITRKVEHLKCRKVSLLLQLRARVARHFSSEEREQARAVCRELIVIAHRLACCRRSRA